MVRHDTLTVAFASSILATPVCNPLSIYRWCRVSCLLADGL